MSLSELEPSLSHQRIPGGTSSDAVPTRSDSLPFFKQYPGPLILIGSLLSTPHLSILEYAALTALVQWGPDHHTSIQSYASIASWVIVNSIRWLASGKLYSTQWKPLRILPKPPIYRGRCFCKEQKNHFAPMPTMPAESPSTYLNFTTLGRKEFEVFPYGRVHDGLLVDDILEALCKKVGFTFLTQTAELWLLKESIPFDQINSNPWLLDYSTNLSDYATKAFRAQKLVRVWTNRQNEHLHAILRMGNSFE